jgi:hypothetical protein
MNAEWLKNWLTLLVLNLKTGVKAWEIAQALKKTEDERDDWKGLAHDYKADAEAARSAIKQVNKHWAMDPWTFGIIWDELDSTRCDSTGFEASKAVRWLQEGGKRRG